MRSNMVHQFSQVPRAEIPRSSFDRSHGVKTTFDAGYLVPVFVDEVLPGDTFNLRMSMFCRLATPLHPIMDNLKLDAFFFFVPYRLVWTNFVKMFGEQANPTDTTSYIVPTVTSAAGGFPSGSVFDFMGLPTVGGTGSPTGAITVSSLPLRAHNLIYNEWFRDENLQNSLVKLMGDGPDAVANFPMVRRGKRHDYFTSALPWPQKGPAVTLPLGAQAPVMGLSVTAAGNTTGFGGTLPAQGALAAGSQSLSSQPIYVQSKSATGTAMATAMSAANTNVYADLSTATAATINQLRQAFQIQRMYERDARGGTRYTEIIQAHFGVTSPDARLQRPEFLGGGSADINVSPIAQTSSTASQPTPQGNLAAMGTGSMSGVGFAKSFTEHGVIIGYVSARADLNYQQGINKMWLRSTRFDFYWPALSHLGEQAILNKEIYAQGTAADDAVFGYQERYAEYRYKPSIITGQFRSTFAQTLDTWHLAQYFTALPTLSAGFIEDNPPVNRVIAVTNSPHFIADFHMQLRCARPMPVYGVPGMIDHF